MHEHDWQPAPELNSYQTSRYRCACGSVGRRVAGVVKPYATANKFPDRQLGQQFMALGRAEEALVRRLEPDEPPTPPLRWKRAL